ncbi:MAG: hypothetical protein QW177_03390 [Candidatus Nitrosotenuis sp.]
MFGSYPEDKVNKALLAFCIEIVLLRMGKPQYEKVVSKLEKDYKCFLPDCDKNPEFLKRTLQDIFGNAYIDILSEIKKELGEASSKKYFVEFIRAMEKQ